MNWPHWRQKQGSSFPTVPPSRSALRRTKWKAKGRKKTLEALLEKMVELGDDVTSHRILIGHSDSLEIAEELAAMIRERFGDCEIGFTPVNPTAGAHCGPNGIGVTFHAIHR